MIYLGMDLSTKQVAAVGYNDVTQQSFVKLIRINAQRERYTPSTLERAFHAGTEVVQAMKELGGELDRAVVWIEGPLMGRGGTRVTVVQSQVSGAVQVALVLAGLSPNEVHVSSWKLAVVGKGNASKEEIADCIKQRWKPIHQAAHGLDGRQDVLDAAGVCLYGVAQHNGRTRLAKKRKVQKR